ncbi:MAG TPA: DedA family protein [Candidatus Saccharimonadales bacterium]|jgi:membrane-associated protein
MLDPTHLIQSGGLALIALLIFGESGMFIGFFFPGDTLLISAGVFAYTGKLSLAAVCLVASLAAIVGDNIGYTIGKVMGPRLFRKKDGLLFRHEYVERAEKFFGRFGGKAMVFAHFVPVVRTFTPILAGVGKMSHAKFFIFDAIGDTAWAVAMTLVGYFIGSKIPNIDHYILLLVLAAMLFTFSPVIFHLATDKKFHAKLRTRFARRSKKNLEGDYPPTPKSTAIWYTG